MPVYHVFEVQEEIRCRRFFHEIEAESIEEAMEKANAGGDSIDCGEQGEWYFGESGYHAAPEGEISDEAGFAAATENMP